MSISGSKKSISMLREATKEDQVVSAFSRLCLLVSKRREEVERIIGGSTESAEKRLVEMLNDVEFAHENGFMTFFPMMKSEQLVRIVSEITSTPSDELRGALLELHVEGQGKYYDFPASLFWKMMPNFCIEGGQKVLFPYAENTLGLAMELTERFKDAEFTLWHKDPETQGIVNYLFSDRKNVKSELSSILMPDANLSGFEYVLSFGPLGAMRLPKHAVSHFASKGYVKLRTESELLVHRLLNETYGRSYIIAQVPEMFLFAKGSSKDLRDHLLRGYLLQRLLRLSQGTLYPYTNGSVTVIEFTTQSIGETEIELVRFKTNQPTKAKGIKLIPHLVEEKRKVTSDGIVAFTWNEESLFAEGIPASAPSVKTLQLGDVTERIFRGPATDSSKRSTLSNPQAIRVISPSVMGTDIIEVDSIEASDIGVNTAVKSHLLQDDDLIITCRGSLIKISVVKLNPELQAIPSNNVAVVRLNKEKIDPYFLYVYFTTPVGETALQMRQTGTGQIVLSVKDLSTIRIPAISLDEQKGIAQKFRDTRVWYEAEKKKLEEQYTQRLRALENAMGVK